MLEFKLQLALAGTPTRNNEEKTVKRYEGLFILNLAGREEGVKDALDKISAEIEAAGGKVETVQKMDKKNFARVADKKHIAGFYANVIFTGPSAIITQLRAKFALNEDVFRVLFTLVARTETREINFQPSTLNFSWPTSTKSSSSEI